jgi:HTH-type transcriptional regulator / antitoxin HigA
VQILWLSYSTLRNPTSYATRRNIRRPWRRLTSSSTLTRPQSEAYERLEFLSVLVHAYEDAHFLLEQLPTSPDVVTFMLEQKGLSQNDLAEWLGGERPMRAFLQGTCSLSLPQIERLREHLGIPADLLISRGTAPNNGSELTSHA